MKAQVFNPFLPDYEYIPDIEPHVFGGRLYLYGSHDRFGGKKFCMNDYVVWSAPVDDLSQWRFDGEIYRKTQDPDNIAGKQCLWAPDVTEGPDKRYYLYYCLSDLPRIGVAVCNTPNGKFEFLGLVQDKKGGVVGLRSGDTLPFDPALLTDDDGRIWLYYGNGPMRFNHDKKKQKASVCVELYPDMLTIKSEPRPLVPTLHNSKGTGFEGHEFFEASSIRKLDGRYYFIYSSVQFHELCYALSTRPDSGFEYNGVLVSNGDIHPDDRVKINFIGRANKGIHNYIGNNHGSLLKLNGSHYIFYHRHTNRAMFSRQACAEEIRLLPDGKFIQAELTSCGMNGKPLKGRGKYGARIACHLFSKKGALFGVHPLIQNRKHPAFTQDGQDRENDPGQYIENLRDGAAAGFRYFEFQDTSKIRITIRGKGNGKFVVRNGLKERTEKIIAVIPIKAAREWKIFEAPFIIEKGIHALYFTYEGSGAFDFLDFELL
jgi:hypothetical protein